MQVWGIGTDLVATRRFDRLIQRSGRRFLDRWFTPAEVEYFLSKEQPARHVAARFAAKEAVIKALGLADGGPPVWNEIEIARGSNGRPVTVLRGSVAGAAARIGAHSVEVSLSHDAEYATATAIAFSHSSRAV